MTPQELYGSFNIFDTYYSVGPLQSGGLIEKWQFTADVYDYRRSLMNNMFKTEEEAEKFLEYLKEFKREL